MKLVLRTFPYFSVCSMIVYYCMTTFCFNSQIKHSVFCILCTFCTQDYCPISKTPASGDSAPRLPLSGGGRGASPSALGLHWLTSVSQTPWILHCASTLFETFRRITGKLEYRYTAQRYLYRRSMKRLTYLLLKGNG